jgi:hypothetical protein
MGVGVSAMDTGHGDRARRPQVGASAASTRPHTTELAEALLGCSLTEYWAHCLRSDGQSAMSGVARRAKHQRQGPRRQRVSRPEPQFPREKNGAHLSENSSPGKERAGRSASRWSDLWRRPAQKLRAVEGWEDSSAKCPKSWRPECSSPQFNSRAYVGRTILQAVVVAEGQRRPCGGGRGQEIAVLHSSQP